MMNRLYSGTREVRSLTFSGGCSGTTGGENNKNTTMKSTFDLNVIM